jgi:hypothetical protein
VSLLRPGATTAAPPTTKALLARRNRVAALTTAAAGALCVLVAAVAGPDEGPLSALLGAGLVLGFFLLGTVPFAVAGDGSGGRSALAFLVLGTTYVLRILVGVVVYSAVVQSDRFDRTVVGVSVIACALVWVNTQVVVGLARRQQPTLDL